MAPDPHDPRPGGAGPEHPQSRPGTVQTLLAILTALALVWTLHAMPMVTMPVACALLVALAVWPVSRHVQRAVPPKLAWLGPLAAMLVVAGVMALFVTGLWLAGEQVVALGREVGPQLDRALRSVGLSSALGGDLSPGRLLQQAGSSLFSALDKALTVTAGAVLIFFLVLLMLTESEEWNEKIRAAGGGATRWPEIARSVGEKFRIFFFTRLFLGTITAILYVAWLALFGIDYLLLWGLLAVLLNFLPTVGSIIAGTLPVVLAVVQKDPATAAIVAGGLLVIEQVMGNFVDPKVMGSRLSLSPLVVLVSLLFWSWVWGPVGAFLAAPLTVLVTIVFAHFGPLKPIALLFTRERRLDALEEYRTPG